METTFQKNVKLSCPGCEGDQVAFFTNRDGFDLFRCASCHLLFVYPLPSDVQRTMIYEADYFFGAVRGFGYINYDEDKKATTSSLKRMGSLIKKFTPQPLRLLDIGAATGTFVEVASSLGFEAFGADISAAAVARGKEKGIRLRVGGLDVWLEKKGMFSAISYLDVFEHLADPFAELRKIRAYLSQDGVLAINTPNTSSFVAHLLGRHWHLIVPPEHLYLFSRQLLTTLLGREGFTVLYSGCIGKSFTLQYVLRILGRWWRFALISRFAEWVGGGWLGKVAFPLNLRDNMFIIARKTEKIGKHSIEP